jgi:LysM repeat protein
MTSPQYEGALQKLLAGRVEDAQDDFLQILLTSGPSSDRRVMQGLIRARRQLAHDDPVVLRRQAAAFRLAIAQKRESPEGYTPAAMELLAEASMRAATELEVAKTGKHQAPTPETGSAQTPPSQPIPPSASLATPSSNTSSGKAEPGTVRLATLTTYTVRSRDTLASVARRFGVSVRVLKDYNQLTSDRLRLGQQLRIPTSLQAQKPDKPQATASPFTQAVAPQNVDKTQATVPPPGQAVATPNTPPSAPAAVAPPTPPPASIPLPPISETGSSYLVQIGPIASSDRASEIAGQLTLAGFAARTTRRDEPQLFRVVSAPLLREVAERRAVALAQQGYHPGVNILADGRAQLDFGRFPSEEGATAYAQQVRRVGFNAQVTREGGTFYTITLGPYQQPAVDAITGVVASFGANIQVSPAR